MDWQPGAAIHDALVTLSICRQQTTLIKLCMDLQAGPLIPVCLYQEVHISVRRSIFWLFCRAMHCHYYYCHSIPFHVSVLR